MARKRKHDALPLPSQGGSWIRTPAGELVRQVEPESAVSEPVKEAPNAD